MWSMEVNLFGVSYPMVKKIDRFQQAKGEINLVLPNVAITKTKVRSRPNENAEVRVSFSDSTK